MRRPHFCKKALSQNRQIPIWDLTITFATAKEDDMEVAAIAVSLAGFGLAVTMALRDERRTRLELAQSQRNTRQLLKSKNLRTPGRGRY